MLSIGGPPVEVSPYIFFDGNCEAALKFYKDVFGGDIVDMTRVSDTPMASKMPPDQSNRVMHATFKGPGINFMAADGTIGESPTNERISLSIGTGDMSEGERIFKGLSEGGNVTMPLEDQFWGARFGQVTDKFGIDWMMNIAKG
jgi:PhnB protein